MGKKAKDTETKAYMSQNDVFADAFNYYVYGGRQVIDPESLHELDTTELAVIVNDGEEDTPDTEQRYRDVLKSAAFMKDDHRTYVIMGIENQDQVHYAMPVRNSLYDDLQYMKQIQQTKAFHRNQKDYAGHSGAEFLSGFYKEDRLTPVITLVLYFGSDAWDGPMSIREMMDEGDPELMQYVQDYRINLLQPADLKDGDERKFHTSLGNLLRLLQITGDRAQLKARMRSGDLPTLPADAARIVRACAGINIEIPEGAEEINMCKAFDEIVQESVAEGEARGIALGEARGEARGLAAGVTQGRAAQLYELVKKGLLALNVAATESGQSEAEFQEGMDAYYA